MPSSTARSTRTTLLDKTETLIRGRGYSGFSYADLSRVVGIRKASIHHHFPTKEMLALAALDAFRERYATELRQIEQRHPGALERIEAYAGLYLQGIDRGLGCLCANLAGELETLPDRLRQGVAAFFDAHVAWLAGVWREGTTRAEVRDDISPDEAAHMILATLEGALMIERLLDGHDGFGRTISVLRRSLSPCS